MVWTLADSVFNRLALVTAYEVARTSMACHWLIVHGDQFSQDSCIQECDDMLHYLHNESGEDHAERGLWQGRIAGSWGNPAGVPTDAAVRADLMASARQHHIRCASGEIAPWVLLPGDPARAERIGGMLDAAVQVAANREFTTYTGLWNGAPVSVTSTGIGCPSAAIAVEELIRCGATMLVRVGTSGSMQPDVAPGDFVVATAAVRDEGTSRAYPHRIPRRRRS
jgi:hypothetical protein